MMQKLWIPMIVGGLLVAGAGLSLTGTGLAIQVLALLLLTVGLLSCLAGVVGASGMMAWLPGMESEQVQRVDPD